MLVVIVGGGLVGTRLAQHLTQDKHDVSLLEANAERARHISNRLDCLVIHDEGNSMRALEEAGIKKADALVCVTDSDEMNMIVCGIAQCKYPDLLKIARVRNEDYVRLNSYSKDEKTQSFVFQTPQIFGIDYFVHPDVEAAKSTVAAIEHGAIGDVLSFAGTEYQLGTATVTRGCPLDGIPLKDYRNIVSGESLVTMLERDGISILPGGSVEIKSGDKIYFLAKEEKLRTIYKICGMQDNTLRRIGIVGGSGAGVLIAEALSNTRGQNNTLLKQIVGNTKSFFTKFKGVVLKSNRRITIIENDYNKCKKLTAQFPGVLVLNEDISDESFIDEERLNDLDCIVTCTGKQELNIITALYLKTRGVCRAIAFVDGDAYAAIAKKLGIDVVIPVKSVVEDAILSRLCGRGLKGIHRIGDRTVDILDIEINSSTPIAGKSITDFRINKGGLVMLVNREAVGGENSDDQVYSNSFIPKGDYVFTNGDRIILIAKNGSEKEIENYFGVSL
ncbi:MAG: Trk system potassium transporter TrkA [Termitinemataceae bacterium]|nr:MAG: Trk system potassium transporter TrkA [Termitinemataceae bacterium]